MSNIVTVEVTDSNLREWRSSFFGIPQAQITGSKAKKVGGFEVYVKDQLIHSKSKGEGVPKHNDSFLSKIKNIVE